MIIAKKSPFEQAADYLSGIKPLFAGLPKNITDSACEIRLRAGQPVMLELGCADRRIKLNGTVTPEQINECVREFCGYSIHSYEKQFKEGWITLSGGHRAGFAGTAVLRNGEVVSIRDVSSVNLRIARQYTGCGNELYSRVKQSGGEFSGLLIIGRPMSAKTTVLRDLCRLISFGSKVALIDERAEVAAVYNGIPSLDVGENTDILNNFPKAEGLMTALRSLSPEYVVCDEIGWESEQLAALTNSGVKMILTAHSGGIEEAYSSRRISGLLETGGISHIALLGYGENIGKVEFFTQVNKSGGVSGYAGEQSA
jgi:stage III sporulation protein AA